MKNERVVGAMRDTPRHEFVPAGERDHAYLGMALPIGNGQTISPPLVVASLTETVDPQPGDKVLEIGAGIEALGRFVRREPSRRVMNASSAFWP